MKRFLAGTLMLVALFTLGSCVVPFPLEAEEDTFNPPRFLWDYCIPQYTQSVVIDGEGAEIITMVVEDLDVNDGIQFRIFKDYYGCTDASSCHLKLLTEGEIPPSAEIPLSDSEEPYGKDRRSFDYHIKKSLLCSSASGDKTGDTHIIEVVITDSFVIDSEQVPHWRKGIDGGDVWSFIVECVDSGMKSNTNTENQGADGDYPE